MTWQTDLNMQIKRSLDNLKPLIEREKLESKRIHLITTRFQATKIDDNYSCREKKPYAGNEGLGFTLTPVQEALLRGIVNYESPEDMDKQDLTAIVTITQGSFMQFPNVKGIGYQGTYILLEGNKKDNYLDEQEVCKALNRTSIKRLERKETKKVTEENMTR